MYDLKGHFHADFAACLVERCNNCPKPPSLNKPHAPRIERELLKIVEQSLQSH